ncbi:hypothetical protein GMMP13_1650020 [Candidatus Magnetomoraceae bacterium gMMP-13]
MKLLILKVETLTNQVLITYPLKQGLKLYSTFPRPSFADGSNYLSTKTRIETFKSKFY